LPDPDASITREPRVDHPSDDASITRHGNYQGELNGMELNREGNDASLTREDDSVPPEMIAKVVINELRISGRYLLSTIADVAKAELNAGRPATEIRDAMIAARQHYDQVVGKLWKPIDVEKFFGDGSWRNEDSWPWKGDQKPKPEIATRRYVNGGAA
jgi:hypothetical protein